MIKITFTIGIGKDKDGVTIPLADQVLLTKRACYIVARAFGGFTAAVGAGGWVAPGGKLIKEESLSITTITDKPGNREEAKEIATYFRDLFNQQCVMVTRDVLQMEMI